MGDEEYEGWGGEDAEVFVSDEAVGREFAIFAAYYGGVEEGF